MVSLFDICTGFQIIVCITLFSGIIYGRHKKTVPLKALIIHNALYLVWAVTVTAVVAKNLLIWWPVFFLAFFWLENGQARPLRQISDLSELVCHRLSG